MSYEMGGKKGLLVVNLKAETQSLHFEGVTTATASVLEVATTGQAAAEPGFAKPITKQVSAGKLPLGPFGIALVDQLVFVE
jgi:hypothetical protein